MNILMSGASGGIGSAIRKTLEFEGFSVANIGRNGAEISCDLVDSVKLANELERWLGQNRVDALVNCAGFGIFEPHEAIKPARLAQLVAVNLTAPMILANGCLKHFKRQGSGHIINIASIEATRHAKFSAAYTATKSGLRDFSLALFEEVRQSNVKVTCINPDMTLTPFFEPLRFAPSEEENTHITPQTIADTVAFVLKNPAVVCDITLRSPRFGIVKKPLR
jgi:short-subunit dehydrogenase